MVVRKALCLALVFCVIWRRASAIETRITVNPELLVLDHDAADEGDTVTVDCEAIGVQDSSHILAMWIERTATGPIPEILVKASANRTDLEVPQSGMTATGSISEMKLQLTMSETKCADARNYTCSMFVNNSASASAQYDSTERLDVEVSPGPVTLTATPAKQSYTVNETLRILCNGPVGTVNNDTQVTWVWKYKDANLPSSIWQTVVDSDGQIEDVGNPIQQNCHQIRRSRLTRILTLADSQRMYRCIVIHNNQEYPQFAGNYTIRLVTEAPGGQQ